MSCYHCEECGELYDDDENVGHQSPTDDGLVCEDCFAELEADSCEPLEKEYNSDDKIDWSTKDIPGFEGTRDQLNGLTIIKGV